LLPRDDAVADVHLPGARTGAVNSVSGTHHRVVGPAVPIETVGLPPADLVQHSSIGGNLRPTYQSAERQQGPTGRFGHVCHHASAFSMTVIFTGDRDCLDDRGSCRGTGRFPSDRRHVSAILTGWYRRVVGPNGPCAVMTPR